MGSYSHPNTGGLVESSRERKRRNFAVIVAQARADKNERASRIIRLWRLRIVQLALGGSTSKLFIWQTRQLNRCFVPRHGQRLSFYSDFWIFAGGLLADLWGALSAQPDVLSIARGVVYRRLAGLFDLPALQYIIARGQSWNGLALA
jgi:hypothetical protein